MISTQTIAKNEKQALLEACRNDYIAFAKYIWQRTPEYQAPRHVQHLADCLQKVERREIKHMMLTMPPRCSKSLNVSTIFPLWYLGRHPNHQIIVCTASQELSNTFGTTFRDLIHSERFAEVFPECRLGKSNRSKKNLTTTAGGVVTFVGVGGTIMGKGAHLLIMDDMMSPKKGEDTQLHQENLWYMWTNVLSTRLMPGGVVIVLQQRLRHNDFVGDLLDTSKNEGTLNWYRVNMPMIATEQSIAEGTDWRKEPGELLWPEWFDAEACEVLRKTRPKQNWEALYQQNPTPGDGNLFKNEHFRIVKWEDYQDQIREPIIMFGDTATSEKTTADYSALVIACKLKSGHILIIDSCHKRVEFPRLLSWSKELMTKNPISALYIEDASSGRQLIQTLKTELQKPVLADSGR